MNVSKDFEELFRLFTEKQVRFVIVGGYAVAFHAKPRYTNDIDVFVEPSSENAERILAALGLFGFGALGLTSQDFSTPGKIIQLGMALNRIDLMTSIDGVSFDEAWEGRAGGTFGHVPVDYIGHAALIKNKRATGRPQDLVDVATIEKFKST